MNSRRYILMVLLLVCSVLTPLFAKTVHAQDSDPWSEVFDSSGNLRPDLVDLGITTETPSWMSIDLPFNQSLNLEANYHRYETADGNIVVLPSASTLFFMAMNPQESGLSDAVGMMGNGYGGLISFLGLVAGDSVDWTSWEHTLPTERKKLLRMLLRAAFLRGNALAALQPTDAFMPLAQLVLCNCGEGGIRTRG